MNVILLVPKVVQGYISRFPETVNNAYKYFNYDRRVYEERVPRGDIESNYKGPDEFTDADYDGLVSVAKTLVNPILIKYSPRVACEDALHQAIRSYGNGQFDGKVNANRYAVLLQAMMGGGCSCFSPLPYKFSSKKKDNTEVKPGVLKSLGLSPKNIPVKERARLRTQKGPALYREKGKVHLKKAGEVEPNEYLVDFLDILNQIPTKDIDVIRRLVGRWKISKGLIKEFLSDCLKAGDLDSEYVQKVSEDVKQAVALLDKLESIYGTVNDFDMEKIKTHMEPLQEMINKIKQPEQEPAKSEEPQPDIENNQKEMDMLKNAKELTEKLDKIAEEVEKISPEAALQIDMISDVIEGKREASTLQFDADEARFMKDRFNFDVRQRDADEPYMDNYKESNFEQVSKIKKNPEPVKKNANVPYQKVQ